MFEACLPGLLDHISRPIHAADLANRPGVWAHEASQSGTLKLRLHRATKRLKKKAPKKLSNLSALQGFYCVNNGKRCQITVVRPGLTVG